MFVFCYWCSGFLMRRTIQKFKIIFSKTFSHQEPKTRRKNDQTIALKNKIDSIWFNGKKRVLIQRTRLRLATAWLDRTRTGFRQWFNSLSNIFKRHKLVKISRYNILAFNCTKIPIRLIRRLTCWKSNSFWTCPTASHESILKKWRPGWAKNTRLR